MNFLDKLRHYLSKYLFPSSEKEAKEAYDIWSKHYDAQPDNLMLALDEALFSNLIAKLDFTGKTIADIGCGTGRHWEKMYAKQPSRMIGFDVSPGMLKVLNSKFPDAETYVINANSLDVLSNNSCDIIVSTLALAHIDDLNEAFTEWNRVLKEEGHIIITDYHPDTLLKGGDRTFMHNGKQMSIKNNVYPISAIKDMLEKLGFKFDEFVEKKIDESVRHYYEKQNALKVYERFKGTPIIYGAHLTRTNAAK
jgi:ubiquinone/menaquinone biosynthesis C-methylase UbiE